ncbi:golgin subfamily A member 6-like protein 1 [Gossypium australe]|uniref:Golgin subfamily A member 6-like protein 1 n=1 Tax=Gossypium australe TaxID=47621 RepID=A0A5B6VY53_9ROSI|nr:golgin subfamily A member 6-like protein 1 [Gossypium australe]
MKGRIEELESALHSCELRIELLKTREGRWEEELHHSHDQIRNRDYLMGEAIVQIREREREKRRKNLEAEHCYGTRHKMKIMDQRLDRLEQMQKDIQDQMQE